MREERENDDLWDCYDKSLKSFFFRSLEQRVTESTDMFSLQRFNHNSHESIRRVSTVNLKKRHKYIYIIEVALTAYRYFREFCLLFFFTSEALFQGNMLR